MIDTLLLEKLFEEIEKIEMENLNLAYRGCYLVRLFKIKKESELIVLEEYFKFKIPDKKKRELISNLPQIIAYIDMGIGERSIETELIEELKEFALSLYN